MQNIFQPFLDMWGMAFGPFQQGLGGPGLGAMADVHQYNAQNSYNPFSISSLGKVGPYTQGAIGAATNRFTGGGGVNPGGQSLGGGGTYGSPAPNNDYQNKMKQYYTNMMVNKLGQQR